jgi:hypothetical protein
MDLRDGRATFSMSANKLITAASRTRTAPEARLFAFRS